MSGYTLFGEDLTAPGFIELEYDLPRMEELAADAKDIPDDYAEDYQFGLYVDDYENARNHLLKSLWGLVACADDDANPSALDGVADRARKLAVTLNDLAHYLDALTFGAKITDETEAAFLKCCEVVVDLGHGNELASMLKARFEAPDEPLESGEQFIDYWSICLHLGDYALHGKGDAALAMSFYDVASLDWQGFRAFKGFHAVGHDNARELESWDADLAILQRIYAYRSVSVDGAAGEVRAVLDKYEAFRRCQPANQEERLKIVDGLVAELKSCYESGGGRDDKLHSTPYTRLLALCTMVLRHYSVVPALAALSDLPKPEQEEALALIASYCRDNELAREDPAARFIRGTSRDEAVNGEFLFEIPRVRNAVDEIKRQLTATDVNELSYYTTFNTFKYMLPSTAASRKAIGRLSIMNVAYMNDPSEGKVLVSYLGGDRSEVVAGQRDSAKYPYVFMKCFTPQVDDIPMWSMYGDDGKGVCVILDWQKTKYAVPANTRGDVGLALYRVCYLNAASTTPVLSKDNEHLSKGQRDALIKSLRELKVAYKKARAEEERELILSYLSEINHLFKSSDYSHEKELRLVHYGKGGLCKTSGEPPMLYVQSPFSVHIKELVLGPKFAQIPKHMPYLQNEIEEMCDLVGSAYPKITLSAVRYV